MPRLSISQLSAFTGRDRRTVTDRLQGLDFQEGPDRAHLFDSQRALAAIYLPDEKLGAREAAGVRKDEATARLTDVRREALCRERIPLAIPTALWDAAMQAFTATLKNFKGQKLTVARINELIGKLRTVKLPATW